MRDTEIPLKNGRRDGDRETVRTLPRYSYCSREGSLRDPSTGAPALGHRKKAHTLNGRFSKLEHASNSEGTSRKLSLGLEAQGITLKVLRKAGPRGPPQTQTYQGSSDPTPPYSNMPTRDPAPPSRRHPCGTHLGSPNPHSFIPISPVSVPQLQRVETPWPIPTRPPTRQNHQAREAYPGDITTQGHTFKTGRESHLA